MFRDSKLIEYHLKNIFYHFQKYQIFDGFGNRTGNLHIPSPILYRPCYGHLILFVLIQPYLLCNILRAQEGENAKTLKTEKLFFSKTVYMDFRCTCYILFRLGIITRENKNEELLQIK